MGFSGQECWCGLPCPSPGHLPDPGNEPVSLMSAALAVKNPPASATWEAYCTILCNIQIVQYYREETYLGTTHQPYWNFFAVFSAFICEFVFCAVYFMNTTAVETESDLSQGFLVLLCICRHFPSYPIPNHWWPLIRLFSIIILSSFQDCYRNGII